MSAEDEFDDLDVSLAYQQYRFQYDGLGIAGRIVSHLYSRLDRGPESLAVDVGCGTGAMTRVLAPHFSSVVGVDRSPSQIGVAKESNKHTNIIYRNGEAEHLDFLQDNSVDLVTVVMAIHFLEKNRFFAEADRVLKPGGCIAMTMYDYPPGQVAFCTLSTDSGNREIDRKCQLLNNQIIIDHDLPHFLPTTLQMVKTNSMPSPEYPETYRFSVEATMTGYVDMFVGYLKAQGTPLMGGIEGRSESKVEFYRERLLQILSEISPAPETVDLNLKTVIHCFIYRKPVGAECSYSSKAKLEESVTDTDQNQPNVAY